MATQPTTGDGTTAETAYIVENAEHIDYMRTEPSAFYEALEERIVVNLGGNDPGGAYYNGGTGWDPIVNFTGQFLAKGMLIEDLFINVTGGNNDQHGLFETVNIGATIHDLSVSGELTTQAGLCGLLAGRIDDGCDIQRCAAISGTVTSSEASDPQIGGLVGNCQSDLIDCWSGVDVISTLDQARIGGLVGRFQETAGTPVLNRVFANGSVQSSAVSNVSGLAGIIITGGTILDSAWDTELTGQSNASDGAGTETNVTGLTTAQVADISNFTALNWDIVTDANHDGQFATAVWYHDGVQPRLWYEKSASIPNGTVTFPSGAIYSGRRTWLEAPYAGKGDAVITGHSDIVAGQTTSPTLRDNTKELFAVDRGMSNDFSGTLTGVAGTTLSTGLDLTGVNIGGANDDHYIFRATAGTGVGEEVTVLSRSGGDIVVNTNPGFDGTTEFVLGKLLKGVSKILPKD